MSKNGQFAALLQERGLSRGPVFVAGIMKGHEAASMVDYFKKTWAEQAESRTLPSGHDYEKLGTYFTHFNIGARYGITFEDFVGRVQRGAWEAWLA